MCLNALMVRLTLPTGFGRSMNQSRHKEFSGSWELDEHLYPQECTLVLKSQCMRVFRGQEARE